MSHSTYKIDIQINYFFAVLLHSFTNYKIKLPIYLFYWSYLYYVIFFFFFRLPGDDCPLVWGQCSHCFHIHCIMKWLQSQQLQQQCPMCRQEWKFKE